MPISQNTALFSLLGTTYGGDGKSTFALPDLQGAVPLHIGGAQPGPGLSVYDLGQSGGSDTVTLLDSEIPLHTHSVQAFPNPGNVNTGDPTLSLGRSKGGSAYKAPPGTNVQCAFQAIGTSGSVAWGISAQRREPASIGPAVWRAFSSLPVAKR